MESARLCRLACARGNLIFKSGVSTGFRASEIRSITPGYAYTTGGRNCYYGFASCKPKELNQCSVIVNRGNLKAGKSTSYELSALWDNLDNFQAGATWFYTGFKDKISNRQVLNADGTQKEWEVDPNYVLYENLNIDDSTMQGVELTASWRAVESLVLRANYTLIPIHSRKPAIMQAYHWRAHQGYGQYPF